MMSGKELNNKLNEYLKLRTAPIVLKMLKSREELNQIPKCRRPDAEYTACQILAQAARLNWTIGFTAEDLFGVQCVGPFGLRNQEVWGDWSYTVGAWVETVEDSFKHQSYIQHPNVENGLYDAVAVSPLAAERIQDPDIAIIYANPAQMIMLICGLQYKDYERLEMTCIGESSCADSIGKALATGKPAITIPCFGERRYGGVNDDEMIAAMPMSYLEKAVEGVVQLSKNGLRYPIAAYGIQNCATTGMSKFYDVDALRRKRDGIKD